MTIPVPALRPATRPVDALTEIVELVPLQVPPVLASVTVIGVPPIQIGVMPEMAAGNGFTVTSVVIRQLVPMV